MRAEQQEVTVKTNGKTAELAFSQAALKVVPECIRPTVSNDRLYLQEVQYISELKVRNGVLTVSRENLVRMLEGKDAVYLLKYDGKQSRYYINLKNADGRTIGENEDDEACGGESADAEDVPLTEQEDGTGTDDEADSETVESVLFTVLKRASAAEDLDSCEHICGAIRALREYM